jgi:hypothetical protein
MLAFFQYVVVCSKVPRCQKGQDMAEKLIKESGQGAAWRWLAALLLMVPLAACSGKDWPHLVDVQRPKESQTYTIPAPDAGDGSGQTDQVAPPSTDAAIPLDGEALAAASARLDLALTRLKTAEADYAAALEIFLNSPSGENRDEDISERWSVAQYRLTRLGGAVGDLAAVNRELAALGLGSTRDTPQDLTLALGRDMTRADTAYQGWPDALLVENNRLAVLTPPAMGQPGPKAFEEGGRTPYIRIDLQNPDVAFADDLDAPVRRALQVAPDLRFDLMASGPDQKAAQANLRRVTAALLNIGVPRAQLVVAINVSDSMPGEALIYLRKRSR